MSNGKTPRNNPAQKRCLLATPHMVNFKKDTAPYPKCNEPYIPHSPVYVHPKNPLSPFGEDRFQKVHEEAWGKKSTPTLSTGSIPTGDESESEWDDVMLHIQVVDPSQSPGVTYDAMTSLKNNFAPPTASPVKKLVQPRHCRKKGT